MRTSTWAQIEDDVRVRMDLPAFSATTKPTSAQMMRMGSQSLQRRDAILAEAYGDDYRSMSTVMTTQAGLEYVSLPDDFMKLRDLLWIRGTDDAVRVKRATLSEVDELALLSARSWDGELPRYRFEGTSTLRLMPKPSAAYTLKLFYVQTTPVITASTDVIQDGPGWSEWVVADCCVKIAMLREEDPSMFMAERADAEMRIRTQSIGRDEAHPIAIRDVTGESAYLSDHHMMELLTRHG